MRRRLLLPIVLPLAAAACERPGSPLLEPLPPLAGPLAGPLADPLAGTATGTVPPRVSGPVGAPDLPGAPGLSYGAPPGLSPPAPTGQAGGGDVSLDFADTDIRAVAAQILGTLLGASYTIDPGVRGTATLRTARPVTRAQLLPILRTLLAQNGAGLVETAGLYRVTAGAAAGPAAGPRPPGLPGAPPAAPDGALAAGGTVVALRHASAEDLARVLQPYVAGEARLAADPARNVLLLGGDPGAREALAELIRAFDVDLLAGQSYALLPVASGDARDFATALQDALRGRGAGGQGSGGGALAGVVRVVPMARINAVLVVAAQPGALDQARRVHALVEAARRRSVRGWHVYYLQNSRSNDIAHVLQQAFTPGRVTAQPTPPNTGAGPARTTRPFGAGAGGLGGAGGLAGGAIGGLGGIGAGGGLGGGAGGGLGGGSAGGLGLGGGPQAGGPAAGTGGVEAAQAAPLLGGLDPAGGSGGEAPEGMRIIPNPQNNALLVYATPQERGTIEATLRRLDVLPLQVRIDAVIAEVTLNDALQYGTQFFFRSGDINAVLSAAATTALAANFPGFVLSGRGANAAPVALSALQAVTDVRVLSSPQLMVLDNEAARLQVGQLVPYLTQSAQSTITGNAPVINSIAYRETGVIMEVTPRVNSGGLVTLDIAQEVSDVDTTATGTSGINSPTFSERTVRSRVAVQDGQTIGLAGLIRDNATRGNAGLPWLRGIPFLGALGSTQNNLRQRTELLVLITPRVIHDQRDARALTEDLRDQMLNAAAVPGQLNALPPSGLADPQARTRRRLGLER